METYTPPFYSGLFSDNAYYLFPSSVYQDPTYLQKKSQYDPTLKEALTKFNKSQIYPAISYLDKEPDYMSPYGYFDYTKDKSGVWTEWSDAPLLKSYAEKLKTNNPTDYLKSSAIQVSPEVYKQYSENPYGFSFAKPTPPSDSYMDIKAEPVSNVEETKEEPVFEAETYEPSTVDIEDFEEKLLAQAKSPNADPYGPNVPLKGQKTDVYYDKQMKEFAPINPGAVLLDILKKAQGPKGEDLGPVAQLPPGYYMIDPTPPISGPSGYKKPGTYNPGQFYKLGPGSLPSTNIPTTQPGLSQDVKFESAVAAASEAPEEQKAQGTFQSEYDPQKAKLAAQAAEKYKTGSATQDPFKSSVFG